MAYFPPMTGPQYVAFETTSRGGLPPRPGTVQAATRSAGPETVIEGHLGAVARNVAQLSQARFALYHAQRRQNGENEIETPSELTDETLVALIKHQARVECLLAKYREGQLERSSLAKVATAVKTCAKYLDVAVRAKPSARGALLAGILDVIEAEIDEAND